MNQLLHNSSCKQRRKEPLWGEMPHEQKGFREVKGTQHQGTNVSCIKGKNKVYFCFIDYRKAFDYARIWNILKLLLVPEHLIILLGNLCNEQGTTVRTEFEETEKKKGETRMHIVLIYF